MTGRRWLFDIETDGLLPELTKVHCLVMKNLDTGERLVCNDQPGPDAAPLTIEAGLRILMQAEEFTGHNILLFDLMAIQKLYPWWTSPSIEKVVDTLILARLYKQNIKETDFAQHKAKKFPTKLIGRHSLEAWGVRLGEEKVGLDIEDWSVWTQHMQDRCVQDSEVNHTLLRHLREIAPWPKAELLEHQAALLCNKIETNGIPFNVDAAVTLYAELAEIRERLADELKELFPPWVVFQGEVVSKANNKKTGHTIGAVYSKVLINEFNPQSREHIANRLKAKYGWKPVAFTDGGKPQIDEKVLVGLDYPEAKPLAELFLIIKRIGQIAEGKEAWLAHEKKGWIHHRLNPNGAVTGRATHSKPNISQVPKVGSRFGKQCRALFGTVSGWVLYGVDVAGLELRCLAHYMARYDKGEYGKAVVEGQEADGTDVHSLNTKALGMEPQKVYTVSGKQQTGRNCAKTFIYAFLYGAGDEKIAKTLGKRTRGEGELIKGQFLNRLPALKKLKEAVAGEKKGTRRKDGSRAPQDTGAKRGYLIALDGRHMHIRSSHAALNTLLQGAGAIICKHWMVTTEALLLEAGFKHGWQGDFAFLIWAHDELQIACRTPEIAEAVDKCAKAAIKITEAYFSIKLPLDCGGKIGTTWADTH